MAKATTTSVRAFLIKSRQKGLKWREVGKSFPGVPLGTLCRIAHDTSYEPKSHHLRHALGLEPLPVEVLPCDKCGQLHAQLKRCPTNEPEKKRVYPKRFTAQRVRDVLYWNEMYSG